MRNTMKTAIILIIFLTHFIFFSSVFAQTPEITNGINYLISTQNPDGSFGDETVNINMPFYSTTEAVNTFKVLQETATPSYTNAVQWLGSYPADNEGYIALRMSAFSGGNIDLSSDLNLLLQWRNTDKGWGGYDDYLSSNFHTCLMLQAFKSLNYSDLSLIGNTLGYLMSTQNTDGGWGFYKGDYSNVYMTALVLNALSQYRTVYDLNAPINGAVVYLLNNQNADGGFVSSVDTGSTTYETALAFEALMASGGVGADKAASMQSALDYLTSTQLPDGSWDDDPYSTALALKVFYLFANQTSSPTKGTVTGKILDSETNMPLAGVSITLQGDATVSTVSDSYGDADPA